MSIYMTREQLNRINEAGRQGAALREAVHKGIITEEEAFDIISRPRLEEDEVDGAAIVPSPEAQPEESPEELSNQAACSRRMARQVSAAKNRCYHHKRKRNHEYPYSDSAARASARAHGSLVVFVSC